MLSVSVDLTWAVIAGVSGACIGSFLNVVIYRLPLMMQRQEMTYFRKHYPQNSGEAGEYEDDSPLNLFLPHSHCPECGSAVKWRDNIPMISWLMLRGKCRHCRHEIGISYFLVELAMAVAGVFLAMFYPPGILWGIQLASVALLLSLAVIDFRCQLLPDSLNYCLLWLGLVWNAYTRDYFLTDAILGAVVGYLSLWSLFWLYKFIRGNEAIGFGDMKLLAALGAWFGWAELSEILLISASVVSLWRKTSPGSQPFPFGPGLALAGLWLQITTVSGLL